MSAPAATARDRWRRRVVGVLALAGLVGAVLASALSADPRTLPDAALGSDAVLIAERAAVFFAVYLFLLVVVVQAFKGLLPVIHGITRFEPIVPAEHDDAPDDEVRRAAARMREIGA